MIPSLASLVALQSLDTAIDQAQRRLSELPAAEQALAAHVAADTELVNAAKTRLHDNHAARRQVEKDVAGVEARMARFEDHKAAVKTNHEYQALTHEIATARTDKDALEERILVFMEEADGLARELKEAEAALAKTARDAEQARVAFGVERSALDAEVARLGAERTHQTSGVDARGLALYEQLLKGRRGVAVTIMRDGHCAACHVRLRPHFTQQVRRNDELIQCESCQRILYFVPPPVDAAATPLSAEEDTAIGNR